MADQDDRARSMPLGRARRAIPLVGLAGRTAGEAVVAALQRRIRGEDPGSPERHARAAERYVELLGRSRGVLMKAGQIFSLVATGAPDTGDQRLIYREAMARLQADAPPMDPEDAASVLEVELGAPPDRVFAEFDQYPFAAASIGQVHRARLHDGREVAVKVQYPGVEEAIRADLANTELLAAFLKLAAATVPNLTNVDIRRVTREVADRIGEEIDYHSEADHQRAFAAAYRGHPFIHVPEVVDELCTGRVLTAELVSGMRFDEAVAAPKELRDRWGEVIYRFVFGSLRRLGMFNADPHPGNYLFRTDGTVSFVDFGCVKSFTADQIRLLLAGLAAALDGDADELWRRFVELGLVPATNGPSPREVFDWYAPTMRPAMDAQPYTYTAEFAREVVSNNFAMTGPASTVVRRLDLPPEYVFLTRIDVGVTTVLGDLNATGPWRAILDEWDRGGPPASPLGEHEARFWRTARVDHGR